MKRKDFVQKIRVLHTVPGRMRVHLPGWAEQDKRTIETRFRQVHGIYSVQANALTGNILIHFDSTVTNKQALLGYCQLTFFILRSFPY
jgi:cation-transporting ATPase I